jgi:cytochrome oxidase Cu insertion factor (SCO1/SenC/PrrC family)
VEEGFAERYDYALQTLTELPYRSWREFDPEDSMRFYALRMHEVGFISASPTAVIAEGTEAAHEEGQRFQTLGAAPEFALTSQDGAQVTLASLRGKVVAVTFIYTSCPDVCPMLTDKLARVQDELGSDFGSNVAFVSITADRSGTPPRC